MIDVKSTLKDAGDRMEMAAMYLDEQLSRIRAGRANIAILDGVRVSSYGSMVPLNQVANVSAPDARTIAIAPWDKKLIKDIEKAILGSDIGITPSNDGTNIRLIFPELTEERRKQLSKEVRKEGEDAKIALRNIRRDGTDAFKKLKGSDVSEDEIKDLEEELQKLTDRYVKEVDKSVEEKSKEIMTI